MGTADKLGRKQAEREVARGFLEAVVVSGLALAAIAVPVALFVFLHPFGPLVAMAVVAMGSWWFTAGAGFGPAALASGLAGGVFLFIARVGPVFVRFWRPNPFLWLGREAVALAVLYAVLFAAAWWRTWRADGKAEERGPAAPPAAGTPPTSGATATPEYTDAEFVVKG